MSKKPDQKKGWIPAFIAGGGFFTLFSMIFGVFRGGIHPGSLTLGLALSVGVGALIKVMASGLDLTTHNRQDEQQNAIRAAIGTTGNAEVDAALEKALMLLQQIHLESKKISDEDLNQKMALLEERCASIFQAVAEKPAKISQIRKLMDYYLPTTLKMLQSYRELGEKGLSVEELMNTRSRISNALDVVTQGCQKTLDKLYHGVLLDVNSDIDVLEKMLKRDGLTESDLEAIIRQTKLASQIDQEALRIAREKNAAMAEAIQADAVKDTVQEAASASEEAHPASWKSGVNEKVEGLTKKAEAHIPQVPTLDGGTFYAGAQAQAEQKE